MLKLNKMVRGFEDLTKLFSKETNIENRLQNKLSLILEEALKNRKENIKRKEIEDISKAICEDIIDNYLSCGNFSLDTFESFIRERLNNEKHMENYRKYFGVKEQPEQKEQPEVTIDREILNKAFEAVRQHALESSKVTGNFENKLSTPEALRAYLYLLLPEEKREPFKGDFERLVVGSKEIDINKFFKEIESYIDDFINGKKRESILFPREWLPKELMEEDKDKLRENLKNLGINEKNGEYFMSINPYNIQNIVNEIAYSKLEILDKFKDIGEKLGNVQDLLKEAKKILSSIPEGKEIASKYEGLVASLVKAYKEGIQMGMTEEEAKKFLRAVTKLESQLKNIVERGRSVKSEREKERFINIAKNWFKENGGVILSSIGFWGLAVGWFLPLFLINKMYETIEKGPLMKK